MDTLGFHSMDPENMDEIEEFFMEVVNIQNLMQSRNKGRETKWTIPGYHGVLEGWVQEFAMDEIPSKTAPSSLGLEVTPHFIFYIFP